MKKKMKGIILAGGKGTRLWPLTMLTSKQLLTVYDRQMIFYPLNTLIMAGIEDILIIVAPDHVNDFRLLLGDGSQFGVAITIVVQEEANGLAEAFIIGKDFIGDDNVTMILGDNIFSHDFTQEINSFQEGGRIFARKVLDPERFGVVEFDEQMKVLSIEEKPTHPKSNYAVPGLYIFDSNVCQFASEVKPSSRGEIEIIDIHERYRMLGKLDVGICKGDWEDAGTFLSLYRAAEMARSMNDWRFEIPMPVKAVA